MRPDGLMVRIATCMGLGPCAMLKVSPRFDVKSHRFVLGTSIISQSMRAVSERARIYLRQTTPLGM